MASSERPPAGSLAGVRILSFGSYLAGNAAAMVLAELGADVVKIESHVRPETLRFQLYPEQPQGTEPSGQPTTSLFCGLARSVRSLALEMDEPGSVAVFKQLVAAADVVIENFGSGVMAGWGCSYEELAAVNPRLVMLSISGYGRTGPLASYRAYASTISHHVGLSRAWSGNVALQHFDWSAALQGTVAVLAAVPQVARDGEGMLIDLAQAESAGALMAPVYLDVQAFGDDFYPRGNDVPGSLVAGVFASAGEDRWVAIEIEDADDWRTACEVLDRPDLGLVDEARMSEHRADLHAAFEWWAAERTPMQATLLLQHRGLAAGPVQNGEDLYRDPQLRSRSYVVEVDHPDLGPVEYPTSPHRASVEPGRVRRHGPRLGQHTRDVLTEWLELTDTDITDLLDRGAVWAPPTDDLPAEGDRRA